VGFEFAHSSKKGKESKRCLSTNWKALQEGKQGSGGKGLEAHLIKLKKKTELTKKNKGIPEKGPGKATKLYRLARWSPRSLEKKKNCRIWGQKREKPTEQTVDLPRRGTLFKV